MGKQEKGLFKQTKKRERETRENHANRKEKDGLKMVIIIGMGQSFFTL